MPRTLVLLPVLFLLLHSRAQDILEVTPLDLKPSGEDYAPVFLDSGFVMVSVREGQGLMDFTDARTHKPLSDLYWVPFRPGWTGDPVLFSQALTTPVNEGPATFTASGDIICYTRNIQLPKRPGAMRQSEGQLGLFFSSKVNGQWSMPEPFPYNSSKYSIIHPTFSAGGDSLVFASDMPGGSGGMDLYLSIRTGPSWSQPMNLGPALNSSHHEVYPRYQRDGGLRFASDRPGGSGGLDILSAISDENGHLVTSWLPAPINGPGNDLVLEPIGDGQHELLSSDRDGHDGIHLVKRTVNRFRDCQAQTLNNYCFSLKTKQPAVTNSLPLDHVWDMGDGTRIEGLLAQHCYAGAGTYTIRSMLVDRRTKKVFHVLRSHDLEVNDVVQAFVASPDTLRTGRTMALDARMSHVPDLLPDEYHWDLGDGSRKQGAKVQHQYRVPGTYMVRLDIIGRPDQHGHIRNHCSTKIITVMDRYREDQDITVVAVYQDTLGNTHTFEYQELPFDDLSFNGSELTDAKLSVELFASKERISLDDPRFAQVRRHYPVVEQFDPLRGMYVYSVGATDDMEEIYEIYKKVRELQFLEAEVFTLHEESVLDPSQLAKVQTADLDRKKLRLDNILFEYRSASLDTSAIEVLEEIATLLKLHPDLVLVIEAHTDGIGSREYNLDLSQQRANSVVERLAAAGLEHDRLMAVGHGKNQPVASNKTEEGRRQNRRVEFRMMLGGAEQVYEPRR